MRVCLRVFMRACVWVCVCMRASGRVCGNASVRAS